MLKIKYENIGGVIHVNGDIIDGVLIESIQWDQGIPKWQAALALTHPDVVVNDEVEAMVGNMDNKPRMDFHVDTATREIESVQIYI